MVYPVNPERESVHGVQAYAGVGETHRRPPDLAVVCTPAPSGGGRRAMHAARPGYGAVAVLSAGFRETGEEGAALERQVAERGGRASTGCACSARTAWG